MARLEDTMSTMTKRFALFAGAAALALGLGSVYVFAQNTSGGPGAFTGRGGPGRFGGPGGPGGPMGPLGQVLRRLDLTDAQREQVKGILDSHKDEMKGLGDKGMAAHKALLAAITADAFDESAVRAKSADVAAVETDMSVLQAKVHGEVFAILTADQQKQAKTLQAEMLSRGPGGPGGPGGRGGRRPGGR